MVDFPLRPIQIHQHTRLLPEADTVSRCPPDFAVVRAEGKAIVVSELGHRPGAIIGLKAALDPIGGAQFTQQVPGQSPTATDCNCPTMFR